MQIIDAQNSHPGNDRQGQDKMAQSIEQAQAGVFQIGWHGWGKVGKPAAQLREQARHLHQPDWREINF